MPRNVNVPQQKVWGSIPLQLPLIRMSTAEATWLENQPQIYDNPYPLDFDGLGLDPKWWQDTGMGTSLQGFGDVGGGNVRLMPWELGYGFSGLGATKKKTTKSLLPTNAQQTKGQKQAAYKEPKAVKPNPNIAKCTSKGGLWDTVKNACDMSAVVAKATNDKNAADCTRGGGTWDPSKLACTTQQMACTAAGNYWNNKGQCIGKPQQDCVSKGGTWDLSTGVCTGLPAGTPTNCPTAPSTCSTGQIIGTDYNGCQVCVPDPNYQGGGGQQQYPPPPYPQQNAMPPPDFSAGGGGGGGGFPMQQSGPGGAGPQMNDQANMFAPPVAQQEEPAQSDEQQQDTGSSDDSSKVADSNIFESISKLFSGMNGLGCGCNAPPKWFNEGNGGNVPSLGAYFASQQTPEVPSSVFTGVIGASVVLMVGAAAIFLWSKGGKK